MMMVSQPFSSKSIPAPLRRFSALVTLDSAAATALQEAMAAPRTASPRTELLSEGRPIQAPMLILDGWAARVKITRDGRRQFVSLLLPGDVVGFSQHRHPAAPLTVQCLTAVEISPAPAAALSPSLREAYAIGQALEDAYLFAQITRLGRLNALERLIDLLLELHERLALAGRVEGWSFDLPLTQEMLGDALGLTSVHINRTIQQARHDGLFEWRARRISILDPERLAARVGRTPTIVQSPDRAWQS